MIDFHSHILPNIDDGSKSIEESINLIEEAKKAGFTDIILTSHYLENYYEANNTERQDLLKQICENNNLDVKLYLGSEIFVTENIINLINERKASTINNSKYVLFELPMNNNVLYLKELIFRLIENNFIPIIAHPERYSYVKKNPNMLLELIEMGVLFQSNYASIIGYYGKDAQITVKKLLKNNMIHFLGTDVHRQNTIYKKIPEILEKLEKLIGKEKLYELSNTNPKLVLENKEIIIDNPTKIKLSLWDKIIK